MSSTGPYRCLLILVLVIWSFAAVTAQGYPGVGQESQTQPPPEKIEAGKQIYDRTCSGCHGPDGSGGFGPDIRGIPARLGDERVVSVIMHGIPGTGMASFPLIREDALEVAAYLRSLGNLGGPGSAKGNAEIGKQLFRSQGCSECHTIMGQGGEAGPELTRIGAVRAPGYLRETLLRPGADLPREGAQGAYRGRWIQYLMFRAVTKDGHTVEGTRIGEDSFHIVLKDATGAFHSLYKPDLRSLEKEFGKSSMPSYQDKLSASELDDLVAYLAGLRGAP